jgi:aldehyde dehydrogenase (NAD+)
MQKKIEKPINLNNFYIKAASFAKKIGDNEPKVIDLLTTYETHETALDEIERSISALRGFPKEFESIKDPVHGINFSTFFPLNLPLYSLVLFGIAPSAFANNVFIRPPEVMHDILQKLWELLKVDQIFPTISLHPTPRHIFMKLYAQDSEVILFTGKYENALDIHKKCPESMLIYNGSGINPILVCSNADVDLAVKKTIEMRVFNSGQDCAGPDAIFVSSGVIDEFTQKLKKNVSKLSFGPPENKKNRISYTIKLKYLDEISIWLDDHKDQIIKQGKIDKKLRLVKPYILKRELEKNDKEEFHEFFAPIFYILEWSEEDTLESVLLKKNFKDRGMYISIFGNVPILESKLGFLQILRNKIVNDVEQGNKAYGGYGPKANFVLYKDQKEVRPMLISKELDLAFRGK